MDSVFVIVFEEDYHNSIWDSFQDHIIFNDFYENLNSKMASREKSRRINILGMDSFLGIHISLNEIHNENVNV